MNLVAAAAEAAAASARQGHERKVGERRHASAVLAVRSLTRTTRYMYDFQNDKPLVAGVWHKVADAPA
jgi:hypothetical protein